MKTLELRPKWSERAKQVSVWGENSPARTQQEHKLWDGGILRSVRPCGWSSMSEGRTAETGTRWSSGPCREGKRFRLCSEYNRRTFEDLEKRSWVTTLAIDYTEGGKSGSWGVFAVIPQRCSIASEPLWWQWRWWELACFTHILKVNQWTAMLGGSETERNQEWVLGLGPKQCSEMELMPCNEIRRLVVGRNSFGAKIKTLCVWCLLQIQVEIQDH